MWILDFIWNQILLQVKFDKKVKVNSKIQYFLKQL